MNADRVAPIVVILFLFAIIVHAAYTMYSLDQRTVVNLSGDRELKGFIDTYLVNDSYETVMSIARDYPDYSFSAKSVVADGETYSVKYSGKWGMITISTIPKMMSIEGKSYTVHEKEAPTRHSFIMFLWVWFFVLALMSLFTTYIITENRIGKFGVIILVTLGFFLIAEYNLPPENVLIPIGYAVLILEALFLTAVSIKYVAFEKENCVHEWEIEHNPKRDIKFSAIILIMVLLTLSITYTMNRNAVVVGNTAFDYMDQRLIPQNTVTYTIFYISKTGHPYDEKVETNKMITFSTYPGSRESDEVIGGYMVPLKDPHIISYRGNIYEGTRLVFVLTAFAIINMIIFVLYAIRYGPKD